MSVLIDPGKFEKNDGAGLPDPTMGLAWLDRDSLFDLTNLQKVGF